MITVTTQQGKHIEIISHIELRDPLDTGTYVRAYCHIHGSDHQRSLSINRATGWGHCFNASCQATVLVTEWNPTVAARLIQRSSADFSRPDLSRALAQKREPLARQLVLLHPPREIPAWQQDELTLLQSLHQYMSRSLLSSRRVREYLKTRGISLEVARAAGVCYLPPSILDELGESECQKMRRWADRVIFPLVSPEGYGYIGRSLWGWRPGMDENRHRALLEQAQGPRRWIKTNPAGWFSDDLAHLSQKIILVEGGFDRLALLLAGFRRSEVIALAGTSAHLAWLPPQVKSVVLALDSDQGGREATVRLADECRRAGLAVQTCSPPCDRRGKDWNERWRSMGLESIFPLLEVSGPVQMRTRSA